MGFVAGFTGKAFEEAIVDKGIETDFVHLDDGFSKINVKTKSDKETELNGQGPKISNRAIEELYKKLDRLCDGDTLVLAGSMEGDYEYAVRLGTASGGATAFSAWLPKKDEIYRLLKELQ